MVHALEWLADALGRLESDGLLRRRRSIQPLTGSRCVLDGRELRNFAGNDYLDLAGDPRVIASATEALSQAGTGARASALVCGRTDWHVRLEQKLAEFEGTEAALLFPTGYAANVGTVAALAGPEDVIYSDRLNHASLIDGCRLSRAKLQVYPHGDTDRLSSLLSHLSSSSPPRRRLIVTDSVFSMDGDLAPLQELCEVARLHEAMLLVDEAHATGVFGVRGRGVAELLAVEQRPLVRVGTLSKAVGSQGGFVTGSRALIDWLWHTARPQVFSTALAPAACAAACSALDIIDSAEGRMRRQKLATSAALFRRLLRERGVAPLGDDASPIVPIIFGAPESAMAAAARLQSDGFLVGAIRPPSVPRGTSRLRITLSSAHGDEILRDLVNAVGNCHEVATPA